jgi:hypothetical protein
MKRAVLYLRVSMLDQTTANQRARAARDRRAHSGLMTSPAEVARLLEAAPGLKYKRVSLHTLRHSRWLCATPLHGRGRYPRPPTYVLEARAVGRSAQERGKILDGADVALLGLWR